MDLILSNLNILEHQQLGPGVRVGVWLSGCPFRCMGCTTPNLQKKSEGTKISIEELASKLVDINLPITFSGGEPFAQAQALATLIDEVKAQKPNLNVLAYSGFTFEEIKRNRYKTALLERVDAVIDGRFEQLLHRNFLWLGGSANQSLVANTLIAEAWQDDFQRLVELLNNHLNKTIFKSHFCTATKRMWVKCTPAPLTNEEKNFLDHTLVNLVVDQQGNWTGIPPYKFSQLWHQALASHDIESIAPKQQ